jgi:hypothetical protein
VHHHGADLSAGENRKDSQRLTDLPGKGGKSLGSGNDPSNSHGCAYRILWAHAAHYRPRPPFTRPPCSVVCSAVYRWVLLALAVVPPRLHRISLTVGKTLTRRNGSKPRGTVIQQQNKDVRCGGSSRRKPPWRTDQINPRLPLVGAPWKQGVRDGPRPVGRMRRGAPAT